MKHILKLSVRGGLLTTGLQTGAIEFGRRL